MLADAGSIPAASTKLVNTGDYSRPTKTDRNQVLNGTSKDIGLVCGSPHWAPPSHNRVTSASHLQTALSNTNHLGTDECSKFRRKVFDRHQPFCLALSSHYLKIAQDKSYVEANLSLLRINDRLQLHDLNLSCSDADLTDFCKKQSEYCRSVIAKSSASDLDILKHVNDHFARYTISSLSVDKYNPISSLFKRAEAESWWRRKIRIIRARVVESIARDIGLVSKVKNTYCSKWGQSFHDDKVKRNAKLLETMGIVNQQGDTYSLKELADKSVSNPEIRRAELMVRMRGFETVANNLGHVGGFYTLTAPSKMHAFSAQGIKNPKYNGTTPRETNDYLNNVWKLVRASFCNAGIKVYGFRVVEPHHDGTPHWHLMLFHNPSDTMQIQKVFKHYAMMEDGQEAGAEKHRFKVEMIDPSKGSATGYIAKYISKNINGKGIDEDLYGNEAKSAAKAITAWTSIWGIRQFQQIGGPSVTAYRELRRLETEESGVLEQARKAADESDWAAYVMAMGGPSLPQKERPIKVALWVEDNGETVDLETGEIIPVYDTKYGNTPKGKVFGLLYEGQHVLTRFYTWTMQRLPKASAKPNTSMLLEMSDNALDRYKFWESCGLPLDLCQ